MSDRRKGERRSFMCKHSFRGLERRETIIKAGRRIGKKERRSLNRCQGSLCWYVKNLREDEE